MKLTVLAGGVGGARFTRGLRHLLTERLPDGAGGTTAEITVVVNTGDDMWLHGVRVCPDLDTVMYTLGGAVHEEQGWGRRSESRHVSDDLQAYGLGWDWFTLGDLDLATHLARTELLRAGLPLSEVTARLCERWRPGVRILPMSDQEVETHVVVADGPARERRMHFEEWWVRHRASLPALRFEQVGLAGATAAPGVLAAITEADVVMLPPSNPVVSIGTILALPGVRAALATTAARVVGVSPIIGGMPVRGMADACLAAIGVETSAGAVARHYGARHPDAPQNGAPQNSARPDSARHPGAPQNSARHPGASQNSARQDSARQGSAPQDGEPYDGERAAGGLLDAWLVDTADAGAVSSLIADGFRVRAAPTLMTDIATTSLIAAEALALVDL